MILSMAKDTRRGRPDNHRTPQRVIRIEDGVWNAARERYGVPEHPTRMDPRTMTALVEALLQGYVSGKFEVE